MKKGLNRTAPFAAAALSCLAAATSHAQFAPPVDAPTAAAPIAAAPAMPAASAAPPVDAPNVAANAAPPAPGAPAPGAPATATTEDIRDIRGPKRVLPVWLIAALVAAVLLLAWATFLVIRRLRRPRPPRALLSFELALQRLDAIRALLQPSQAREFSIAVSDIVRTYIEQRFDAVATHQTTEEFLHDLLASANTTLARHRGLLEDFLKRCDLVKFAGVALTLEDMQSLHHSARAFVLETRDATPEAAPKEAHDPLPAT